MIGIVNYGLGNIQAFLNVYKSLGIDAISCVAPQDLALCDRLIIPGVGSFDCAMEKLNSSGMRSTLDNLVLQQKVPVLGVCVGFQIMAHCSDEGRFPGLSWLNASVRHLSPPSLSSTSIPLPHMGWNNIDIIKPNSLVSALHSSEARFYFLHSFFFDPVVDTITLAQTTYGHTFTCAASFENIHGVQFHPEKSHSNGTTLLRNFSCL